MTITNCPNCGEQCERDDLFCESCGYDFITGSLPSGPDRSSAAGHPAEVAGLGGDDQPTPVPSLVGSTPPDPPVSVTVAADPGFFAAMVTEGEVDLPDPLPPQQELELYGRELHIGRTSESRGVHPNIDVEALTGDPAVSTRHAVLRVANDGARTITDIGSTNGTYVDDFTGEPITQGVPVDVRSDSVVYLGAWTRLTVRAGDG